MDIITEGWSIANMVVAAVPVALTYSKLFKIHIML